MSYFLSRPKREDEMKKILISMFLTVMVVLSGIVPTMALTYDESYNAAKSYYSQTKELYGLDEVLAYEALGLQSESLIVKELVKTDYASDIAKTIIGLVLHGDDPRDFEGVNYVEMLENCVQENGAVDKTNSSTYANFQFMCVNALYVVNSSKTELAADYLASLIDSEGAFGSSWGSSLDITGWVVETLSLVNKTKYHTTIDKSIQHFKSVQEPSAGYKDSFMGVNASTQACVLMALLTYDQTGVKATTFNQGDNNPYDVLLTYQNDNGSFWYSAPGEDNPFNTLQGTQTIGYYYNGSVYMKAKNEFKELTSKPEEVVPPKEEVKEEPKKEAVQTADEYMVYGYTLLLLISGFVLIKGKKFIG